MADERTARLGNEQTALPEVHALVRWQPSQGRVRFGHLSAYQNNFADQVLALMVTGPGQTEPEAWPPAETTVVDQQDPKQLLEWIAQ